MKKNAACMHRFYLFREGRPRLDLEYPVYGAHELADEGAFTSVCQPPSSCNEIDMVQILSIFAL